MTEDLRAYEKSIGLILADDLLTEAEKKTAVNDCRRAVMLKYAFYSPQMEHVDNFIRQRLREPQRATESRKGGLHGKTDGLQPIRK